MQRIGITLGDCAGIGPEIVRAALPSAQLSAQVEFVIVGQYPNCDPGTPTPVTARAAAAALEEAAAGAARGEFAAVVTGPIHKARMYGVGFAFPGQTEFFASRSGVENYAMLLTGGGLSVALVTSHIALREVAELLSHGEIVRVGLLLVDFLTRRLGRSPRIAVAGLNPHAGESGALGDEEAKVISPAVEQLQKECGPNAIVGGPFSPDTIFYRAVQGDWDGVLCMYHDQGLIPLKLHAFHEGVNVTLGLPFPRTSPDHGTAFEIAGKGIARPDSMIAALNLAAELAQKR